MEYVTFLDSRLRGNDEPRGKDEPCGKDSYMEMMIFEGGLIQRRKIKNPDGDEGGLIQQRKIKKPLQYKRGFDQK